MQDSDGDAIKKSESAAEDIPPAPSAESGENIVNAGDEGKKKKKQKKKDDKKKETKEDKMSKQRAALVEKIKREQEEKAKADAEAKARKEEEERRIKEEEERIKKEKEEAARKKKELKEKKIAEGTYLTPAQKKKKAQQEAALKRMQMASNLLVPQLNESNSADSNNNNNTDKQQSQSSSQQQQQSKVKKNKPKPKEKQETTVKEEPEVKPNEPVNLLDEIDLSNWDEDDSLLEDDTAKLEKLNLENKKSSADNQDNGEDDESNNNKPKDKYRSPISVIMGHVDTGKTTMLDTIRNSHVQQGEAGGITQQIGATFFPRKYLYDTYTCKVKDRIEQTNDIPGLLVIDTPGHESFTNLRSRGTDLCDVAILVVDIMHGLEQQTLESLELLKQKNTPFIVALNKIDRMYQWKRHSHAAFHDTFNKQAKHTQEEFEKRVKETITAFMEKGYNAALYYENKSPEDTINLVPTSAVTGEGVPDLISLLLLMAKQKVNKKLEYRDELQANIMEVNVVEGHGATIDVLLVNGKLQTGQTIVVCGFNGPIVTTIRALLTPEPLKEIRIKTPYQHHKEIYAAMSVKISASDLDDAIAGTSLFVCQNPEDGEELEDLKEDVMEEYESLKKRLTKCDEGVYVQASTLGALEALIEFLSTLTPPIPIANFGIGPIHKRDIIQASVMLEKRKEFATILAFDVRLDKDADEYAKQVGVKIFTADIIYHLFDSFTKYIEEVETSKKASIKSDTVFPCLLSFEERNVFRNKDPLVIGVTVVRGILKTGTPLFAYKKDESGGGKRIISLGRVASIEVNHKQVNNIRPGGNDVAISINSTNEEEHHVMYGRQFDNTYTLYSKISRTTIDCLKDHYRSEMLPDDWKLIMELKNILDII